MSTSDVDALLNEYSNTPATVIVKRGNIYKELTEEHIKEYTLEIINQLIEDIKANGDFRKNVRVLEQLIELKKAYWPATQKQITSNIDLFDKELQMWYKAEKDFQEMERERTKNLAFEIKNE